MQSVHTCPTVHIMHSLSTVTYLLGSGLLTLPLFLTLVQFFGESDACGSGSAAATGS